LVEKWVLSLFVSSQNPDPPMSKIKKSFFCQSCGASSVKWEGRCPSCGEWNTLVEEIVLKDDKAETAKRPWRKSDSGLRETARPTPIGSIALGNTQRIETPDREFNRVLGGGIVPGSLVLIGGEPGIGKSTLLLQIALSLPHTILYVSGEESEEQIKMRAVRLPFDNERCFILSETNVTHVLAQAAELRPDLVVIDSIQTLSSPLLDSTPGSVSQVRECAGELQRFAKETHIPVFLVGHITKDGSIAGPKLLEHIVDAVLQFEGDQHYTYRILRTIKNRFGSTAELGIYEMQGGGLREVTNPSELLLSQNSEELSGSTVAAMLEGQRPMLIETQALVSAAVYGTPQRSATGFDLRRLSMLLAVLEKRCGFRYGQHDVFLNIAGGIRVDDPAIDLAIVAALISSLEDVAVPGNVCFAGEIGLSGEIRAVNRIEQRILEAHKLGFERIFLPKYNLKGIDTARYDIELIALAKIEDLYHQLFV
jgi:DNA repair protein RadA/Sms